MIRSAVWACAFLGALASAPGCFVPCENDDDCPSDAHCGEGGFCEKRCASNADCAAAERCTRGRCTVGDVPVVTWVSPEEGARVGETFDVEVDVRFRGPDAIVRLLRDPTRPGQPCAPFLPQEVRVEGSANEVTQRIVFSGVSALGERFGLLVEADVNTLRGRATRGLSGPPTADPGDGLRIESPDEGLVDADEAYTHELVVKLEPPADAVWGWVEPEYGAPSPRRYLGSGGPIVEGARVPLPRGRHILWVEADRAGQSHRCGVGLLTEPSDAPGPLEVALSFAAEEPADLDVAVYAEPPDGERPEACTVSEPSPVCLDVRDRARLSRYGEKALYLSGATGVYGVAVLPLAATGPVSATLRLSNGDVHLGWLGPRRIHPSAGEAWLAARLYVVQGSVRVEPVDHVQEGAPVVPPSAW